MGWPVSPRTVRRVINATYRLGAGSVSQICRRSGVSMEMTRRVLNDYRGYIFCCEEEAGRARTTIWSLRPVEREQ